MKNAVTLKHSAKVVNSAASMLLFLLFTVCALIMVSIASATYSRINKGFEDTFDSSASIKYISNKIKSSVSVTLMGDNQTGLILRQDGYNTLIYFVSGGIYEVSVAEDVVAIPASSDLLFNVSNLTLTDCENNLLKVSVTDSNNNIYETYCQYEN